MSTKPEFIAEIIIDAEGKVNVRNCSKDLIELLYQLNPHDLNISKRAKFIQQLESTQEVDNEHTL